MTKEKPQNDKFNARERLALWVLFLILKVVKPMEWSHQYEKELNKIKELLDEA